MGIAIALAWTVSAAAGQNEQDKPVMVGVSYFAGWWEARPNKWLGPDGNEWLPRHPERTPLLGLYNSPETMAREIDTAAQSGVDFFAILWYYSPPGQEREPHAAELNRGVTDFMNAPNCRKMAFMVEFCNHPPYAVSSDEDWNNCVAFWLKCFAHPSYLRVNGKLVFKVHSGHYLWMQNGQDWAKCKARLDSMREAVRAAGLGEMLIGCGVGGHEPIPAEHWASQYFDFTGTYMDVPEPSAVPQTTDDLPYEKLTDYVREGRLKHVNDAVPYMPVIGAGWCPRPWGDPRACFAAATPEEWSAALEQLKSDLAANDRLGLPGQKAFTVYAWNEFGEGGFLAPTKGDSGARLEAVQKVFGRRSHDGNQPQKENAGMNQDNLADGDSLPSDWAGGKPKVSDLFGTLPKKFDQYDVILRPDKDEAQWWAGAPSVVCDDHGVFWMACRMRTGEGPRGLRGYEVRILKSADGIHFEKVHSIKREDVPIPGFERPALLIDPVTKKFKLYGCGPWQGGPWTIVKFDDADTPADFIASTAKPVITAPRKSYERDVAPEEFKDPVIVHAQGVYHCYVIGVVRRTERVFHFVSTDGEQWRPVGNPYEHIMKLDGWHDFYVRPASVLPLGVGYLFVYEGSNVKWYDPVYNILTGVGFTFDLHRIIDLTPESPLIKSTTPSACFDTWRYSCWLWVGSSIWIYAEAACPNQSNEIRLFRLSRGA